MRGAKGIGESGMDARVVEVESLPFGQRAVWHSDLNIVSVLRHLSRQERDEALDQLQDEWRRSLCPMPNVA